MAHINLLPWRDELRKEREIRFGLYTGIAVVITALIFLAAYTYVENLRANQQARNDYLNQQIKLANNKIKEIEALEKRREGVKKRISVIRKLNDSRPQIVRLFNDLSSTLPNGVFYKNIKQKNNAIDMDGAAQSNARVSSLMNRINSSDWLEKSTLNLVQNNEQPIEKGKKSRSFKLSVSMKIPQPEDKDKE
ncbi:PilN domain-containing protein [Candidatus Venteria ishoeyi]|uniref:PilN domain-containing protein n=1 Tax=Candidatus Venteria ishoeyi TaxID=1899563 RepID=UPI0025A68848|nr:PilN domain-containing protein [Candidatus Venteria ishoeyi]MDM8547838.1 PilN domain-containing protein [Candidatus Venteria ishoeyi]